MDGDLCVVARTGDYPWGWGSDLCVSVTAMDGVLTISMLESTVNNGWYYKERMDSDDE